MYIFVYSLYILFFFFFFNDTATTEIYTLSLHDALPICRLITDGAGRPVRDQQNGAVTIDAGTPNIERRFYYLDRKSTRLNSSHANISYAVFCLKKKNKTINVPTISISLIPT